MREANNVQKPEVTSCFAFKSKTKDGYAARIEVVEYTGNVVVIEKRFISVYDCTAFGCFPIRKLKSFGVYAERIILRKSSIYSIIDGLQKKLLLK